MTVPEAAINEDDCPLRLDHEVRLPRQVSRIAPIRNPKSSQQRRNCVFGDGSLVSDAGHDLATF